jgi:hypothetical protein
LVSIIDFLLLQYRAASLAQATAWVRSYAVRSALFGSEATALQQPPRLMARARQLSI